MNNAEEQIMYETKLHNIEYLPVVLGETRSDAYLRHSKMRQLFPVQLNKKNVDIEKELNQDCELYGVKYFPPVTGEKKSQLLQRHNKIRKAFLLDVIENVFDQKVSEELSKNPNVTKKIHDFQIGEKKHAIGSCISCKAVRPIFYQTKPSELFNKPSSPKPFKVDTWKIYKDGRCEKCHKEYTAKYNKSGKQKHDKALQFSGIYSNPDEMASGLYHNDMHFKEIPPYLANLTLIENFLIKKVSTFMLVHNLKYGMLASKGHAVAVPSKVSIATKLPLLPEEVKLLILKRKNANSRQYTASRNAVQNALEGLVFGFPKYGLSQSVEGFTQYQGSNHVSGQILKNRWFKYEPNRFYHDATIEQKRLEKISSERSQLDGIPIYQVPDYANKDEEDQGPSEHQFDKLQENEEITSTSGMVTPINPQDLTEEILEKIRKMVGDEFENPLENAVNVDPTDNEQRQKPLKELSTEGFFSMAFPEIFINSSCDYTVLNQKQPKFEDWIQHIYWCKDSRVANHPHLKFYLMNLSLRRKALSQTNFLVNQQLDSAQLIINELREQLENGDESIPRKIINVAANLPNTETFWRDRHKDVYALKLFMLHIYKSLVSYFRTDSMAEHL